MSPRPARVIRARWILPVSQPPIENGWLAVADGVIREIGRGRPAAAHDDLGDTVLLPGLINAHTHLELSWMAGRVPPAPSMDRWIRSLMTLRRESSPPLDEQARFAREAVERARASGTLAFGDISNTLVSADVLAASGTPARLFHELLGFAPHDYEARAAEGAERILSAAREPVKPGLAPHAPYSVAPELFAEIAKQNLARALPASVHLGESPEEIAFLRNGTGAIADMLKAIGVWRDDWPCPGCGPVEYLDRMGVLLPGTLVVHATTLAPEALARVASLGCTIVSCPRSNEWVGVGCPPIDDFYASGARVAFGTDSLASVASLNMFEELAAARAICGMPDETLLHSATKAGADALGLGAEYGTLAPGCRAPVLAVHVPSGVTSVQEYLVAGVPRNLSWVG